MAILDRYYRKRLSIVRLAQIREVHRPMHGGSRLTYFEDKDGRQFGHSVKAQIVRLLEVEDFDPDAPWKPWELDVWADVFLRADEKRMEEEPAILFEEHIHERRRHEIYVASGTPDTELTNATSKDGQTMYWRQSPVGRKVNSEEQRKTNGASYYR
jgi:hypothetical protein